MLTIQPNFTNQSLRRVPAFKGETGQTPEDKYYQEKINFYENGKKEFENLINDDKTAKPLKKLAKTFKVISEMLLEGWAVAWGASKGARFMKASVAEGVNSQFAKGTKDVLKPVGKGLIAAGKKLAGFAESAVKYIKGTPAYTKLNEKLTKITEKMNNNKYGRFALNVLNKIGEGIKVVADFVAKPFKKVANSMKNTSFDKAYDKTAKATSTTLGVGAGAASGYNEVMHPEKAKVENETDTVKPENEEQVAEEEEEVDE